MFDRLRAFFQDRKLDREFDAELQSHLDMLTGDLMRSGLSRDEAARQARLKLGGNPQLREAHRDVRSLPFFDALLQDLRYTARTLRRDPGFTIFAILIVGLGIGASTTVFSVVDALLLRPLPFHDPSKLVWIINKGDDGDLSGQTVPLFPYRDLRDQSHTMADVAAYWAFYEQGGAKMTGDGEPERLTRIPVSQNFFSLLGVQPQLGRSFTVEECQRDANVVILGHGLWTRRFAADPAIIGRKLTVNNRPLTVIGVMPASFDFGSIFAPGTRVDLYGPLPLTDMLNRYGNTVSMVGRLKPGIPIQQAQTEATILSEPIRVKYQRGALQFRLSPLETHVRGHLKPLLLVLSCAVGVVMLIVCANLSNLQIVRAASRQREMAIRVALGAGRGRLIRQMLTESIVLSCCSAILGLGLAFAGTRLLAHLDAFSLPLRESIHVNPAALGFTLLIAVVTGLMFGLVPALQVPAIAVSGSLKEGQRGSVGKSHNWTRNILVVSEIGFACVLLIGAGLLTRSFLRLLDVNLGFRPEMAAELRVDPSSQYNTPALRDAYFSGVLRAVKSVPGVASAGLSDVLPLGHNRSWNPGAKGVVYSQDHPPPDGFVRVVSDGYLPAIGIRLISGRDLSERDNPTAPPVMLINETLAAALFPGRDALGQRVIADIEREVVGIVGDVRHIALERESGCEFYIPIRQSNDYSAVNLVVRTTLPPASLGSAIRAALKPIDPNIPANEFRTVQELVDKSVSPRRFLVLILAGFSLFALILASLGIYALVSYSVNRRTQEIGIRMALGASAGQLQGGIILQTLRLAAIGMAIGVVASWFVTCALSGLLFGVTPTDPATFVGMLTVLTIVAALAGYLPARRASRIDPISALRAD